MKCFFCRSETAPGLATMVFDENDQVLIIKKVPAEICPECGESYADTETTDRVLDLVAESAKSRSIEVQVQHFVLPESPAA